MIDKQTAKEIALSCGFKLKEQENGEMDLNDYVYATLNKVAEHCWSAWQSGVMPHKIHPTKASLNNGWISVDDELPEPIDTNIEFRNQQNKVQVYYRDIYGNLFVDYAWYILCYDDDCETYARWELCNGNEFTEVLYWQPLPQPPKE